MDQSLANAARKKKVIGSIKNNAVFNFKFSGGILGSASIFMDNLTSWVQQLVFSDVNELPINNDDDMHI